MSLSQLSWEPQWCKQTFGFLTLFVDLISTLVLQKKNHLKMIKMENVLGFLWIQINSGFQNFYQYFLDLIFRVQVKVIKYKLKT